MPTRVTKSSMSDEAAQLKAAYHQFIQEQDPARKDEVGRDLMRVIFGKNAIAEDAIR